ncbi:hypothetical protein CISG_04001 [Coccidioides immitis RMSCC 3703]|uniref:Uncharacterized protein n=2 Tax=Coccidioides immitis TaxID=5501 RepID=A0A0J8TK36_COCIT|nr:hypothetical protein CIRG_08599 [Coccidioides immitis RMSCC 2394]KMU74072.1 hypothetical protein CISG_04001 [Coccidioides immitis RMSCC 3703]
METQTTKRKRSCTYAKRLSSIGLAKYTLFQGTFFLSSSTGSERWTRSTISILASPDKGLKYMPVLPRSENTDRFGSTLKNKVVIAGKKPAPETDEPQNGFPELEMGNSHYR